MTDFHDDLPAMHRFVRGAKYPVDLQGREMCAYNYDVNGHDIVVAMANITAAEEKELIFGPVQFALTKRDNIIFLLCKFGALNWMDFPYQSWLVQPELRQTPPILTEEQRILFIVTVVDSTTNIIRGLRAVTPSHEFSQALYEGIRAQMKTAWHGKTAYERQLAKIFRRFSTVDLLGQAIIRCEGKELQSVFPTLIELSDINALVTSRIYVLYPHFNPSLVPTKFSRAEFLKFDRDHGIPIAPEDDEPIDIQRNAELGALKPLEVTVDGTRHTLWIVQPGYYSLEFGLELPEDFGEKSPE